MAMDAGFLLRALPNEDVLLFSKSIDNRSVVRVAPATTRGEWSAIGALCGLALALMLVLTPRVANIVSGYQLESLKAENLRLLEEQREVNLLASHLSREEHLAAIAKQRDMAAPTPAQVIHLDPKSEGRLALNRH